MRTGYILGSALMVASCCITTEVSAQGIQIGTLKKITAPSIVSSVESYAIGYDGDTTDSDEKPSLYGFSNQIDLQKLGSAFDNDANWATITTAKPNGDCLQCELRDVSAVLPEQYFAYASF